LKPYWQNNGNLIYHGDAWEVLRQLEDESINCCVTSPPYWGLRDYGIDGQLGLEKTPEEYVANLVSIFTQLQRVLKNDGTLWLNLGDTYAAYWGDKYGQPNAFGRPRPENKGQTTPTKDSPDFKNCSFKPKDLIGIPWSVALALRDDGWYLRQDIIWSKPNPMPESVKDRCTKAHEYIFLLSKNQKYYYDADVIKEPCTYPNEGKWGGDNKGYDGDQSKKARALLSFVNSETRNKRSVWTCATHPFPEAHFAVYPPALIEPCILAGCPEGETVLDPFFGSGTTGIVAYKHDRKFIGIDLSETYLKDIAIPRIEKETRQLKLF
jgi:DNA modification methylase